jgi:chromosomal replication initiator protein
MMNDQIWEAVLGEIELNLSKANFTTWFKNTFISDIDEERVIVCVPNTFTKAWLEKKYHTDISTALKNVSSKNIKEVIYKVETKKINPVSDIVKKIEAKPEPSVSFSTTPMATNRFGLNSR